jgi:hypothetical protein
MCRLIHIRMAGQVGYIAGPLRILLLQIMQNLVRRENRCKENSEVDRTATERTSQVSRLVRI